MTTPTKVNFFDRPLNMIKEHGRIYIPNKSPARLDNMQTRVSIYFFYSNTE